MVNFNAEQFNKLFPFYLILNNKLCILDYGNSLKKLCAIEEGMQFNRRFTIIRPEITQFTFAELIELQQQLFVFETNSTTGKVLFRGQIEYLEQQEAILIVATPWFSSIEQLKEFGLTIADFAIHDVFIDMLHVLKTQQITVNEIKELLHTINSQKNELQRLLLFTKETSNAIILADAEGKIQWVNNGFSKITGYTPQEAMGKKPGHLLQGKDSNPETIAYLRRQIEAGKPYECEILNYTKDKRPYWIKISGQPLFDRNGKIVNFFAIEEDVTGRKLAEQALIEAEQRWKFALEGSGDGMWDWNVKNNSVFFSEQWLTLLGLTPNNAIHSLKEWEKLIHPDDVWKFKNKTEAYLNGASGFYETEYRIQCCEKKYKWFLDRGMVVERDAKQQPCRVIGTCTDITRQKQTEEELSTYAQRFSTLIQNLQTGILVEDETRHIVLTNKEFCAMFGIPVSPEHLIGSDCSNAAEQSKGMFKNPEQFVVKINKLLADKLPVVDVLELVDGRIFERDYIPIFIETSYKGHLWQYRDITKRVESEQTLRRSEEKYRQIINNMNLGLIETNINNQILFVNQSFCNMSGFDASELMGKEDAHLILQAFHPNIHQPASNNNGQKNNQTNTYELQAKTKGGQLKWWLLSSAPMYNDEGIQIGFIKIYLDITQQKDLEQQLRQAKKDAEMLASARENFLASMSHEIRTPMNAIMGMSKQLQKTPLNEKQNSYLDAITTSADSLLFIINNILDLSKIEAGKLSLENIGFNLRTVLAQTQKVLQHKAEEKGLAMFVYVDPKITPVLIGDPHRIHQILLNLVGNAIKFTSKGHIDLTAILESESKGMQKIKISVLDTGIGMEEKFLQSIFSKFSQEDETIARKFGGSGLGMNITKQIVDLMGGTISVQSQKNRGTNIEVILTLGKGTEKDIPQLEIARPDSKILKNKKILIVEDNPLNRLVAATMLSNYGAELTEVTNGKEAVDLLRQHNNRFDLILLDVQMPVMDGFETTHFIRNELYNNIPIIALTANALKGEREKCITAGMNDYLSKPFEEAALVTLIAKWLKIDSTNLNEAEFNNLVENKSALYDLSKLNIISRNDRNFVLKMLQMFVADIPATVAEIKTAFYNNDLAVVKQLSHRIKPAIDSMGITSLKTEIRRIEELSGNQINSPELENLILQLEQVIAQTVEQIKANELGE